MPDNAPYGSDARKEPVKAVPNPPAATVAQALANSQAAVDATKAK